MIKEIEKRILSSIILIPIAFFFIFKGSVFFVFFLSISFFVTIYEWFKMCKKMNNIKILGSFYLLFSFYLAYLLRIENGFKVFIFVILISILTDIGGYIFGKVFKGPKLTKISPKKTYSGVIGSFILSVFGGLIFVEYVDNFYTDLVLSYTNFEPFGINLNLFVLIFILITSLISQLGDLIISYFKRVAKIKDTGKILPGHGGLLDRIDGIIFAVPFTYVIFNFGKIF